MSENNLPAAWRLGQTSAWYESRGLGPATISNGKGDHGGASYGEYQLSSKQKTVDEFLNQSPFQSDFSGLTPATPAFDAKWVAMSDKPDFVTAQHDFIKAAHYDPLVAGLKDDGLDLTGRGPAVQDALWSTAVQYRGLGRSVFKHGLDAKFGAHADLSDVSDRQLVEAVQDYKIAHVHELFASSQAQWSGLRARAESEKADLIQFAETGVPVDAAAREQATHHPRVTPDLAKGSHGEAVNTLQTQLGQLGYTRPDGHPLVNSQQHFGPATEAAVKSFQAASHLPSNGRVDDVTLRAIEAGTQTHIPSLLDARHPANGIYEQAHACVARIDESQGRSPGPHTQNFAGSLTSAATAPGFNRIDHVALSDDANRGYAIQGELNSPFKKFVEVDVMQAVQTPLAQSSQEAATHVQAAVDQQAQQVQQQQVQTQQQGMAPGFSR
jgi:hypothetical protein